MTQLTFGSLFAGIGGFDLGFERAGMVCKWQVEIDPYAQRVLAKHWPYVRRHDDVRTWPQPDTERVDVICGGFPCQDISYAGPGEGIHGARSGLFFELARIVRELEPRIVVLENVPALLDRGMGDVLGTLAAIGFDAEWEVFSAAAFGASNLRERVFIVAHRAEERLSTDLLAPSEAVRDRQVQTRWRWNVQSERLVGVVGDTEYPPAPFDERWARASQDDRITPCTQRGIRGAVHGISGGVDRIGCVGNAVVPQIAEYIGRRIVGATK